MANSKTQKCIPVINDIHDENFQSSDSENLDDSSLPSTSKFTSIWKNPERLQIPSDYSLLLATLSRELHVESSYSETLRVLKLMRKSENLTKNDGKIDKIFQFLLMQILKEENSKKIDPHQILDWLDSGDRLFSDEKAKKSYAILKLYFLCRNRKAKLECFSCGCVQKYFIDLYTENSNSRLIGALNSLITGRLADLNPVLKRLFLQMPEISSIEYYEYYIELLDELEMCSVIDKSDEKQQLQRVIQLIGLLSELKLEDVPKACSKLYNLMGPLGKGDGKKKSPVIETAVRNKLLPKIFDSLNSGNAQFKSIDLTRNSIQKMVELVVNEKYSYAQQATPMFAPLQFLNRLFGEFDVWEKSWPILKNRLDSMKMSTQQAPVVFLYFQSLVFRNEPSLVGCLVEYLELQYQNSTAIGVKKTILILLEIMENLADSAPSIHTYFKENHPKNRLLLEESSLEISLEYLQNFSNSEINQFLAKKSFKNDEFSIVIEKLKDFREISINSDGFWRDLMEKIDEENGGNSMIFIENQLKILVNRGDRKSLQTRIEQIFKRIFKKSEKSTMECFFVKFPRILMDFSGEEWKMMPGTTTISLVSTMVFGFLTVFEGNELQICHLFRQLHSRITSSPPDSTKSPLEILEILCQKIREKSIPGSLEIQFLKDLYDENPGNATKKEQIVEVSSILWNHLAGEFQKTGDANGKFPFCQLAAIIDDYLRKFQKDDDLIPNFQIWRQISERTMEGYSKWWTEKWNWLFVSRKIWMVLSTARRDRELLERLMRVLNKNQNLLAKLRATNKEFVQLEQSMNS